MDLNYGTDQQQSNSAALENAIGKSASSLNSLANSAGKSFAAINKGAQDFNTSIAQTKQNNMGLADSAGKIFVKANAGVEKFNSGLQKSSAIGREKGQSVSNSDSNASRSSGIANSIGTLGSTLSKGVSGLGGIISNGYVAMISAIFAIPQAILGFKDKINNFLDTLADFPRQMQDFADKLSERLSNAIQGVGREISRSLQDANSGNALLEFFGGLIKGIAFALYNFFAPIFGLARLADDKQEKRLQEINKGITGFRDDQVNALKTSKDFLADANNINSQILSLDKAGGNYFENLADLAEKQFSTLKDLDTSIKKEIGILQGVLSTLDSSLDAILGGGLAPKSASIQEQQVRFVELLTKSQDKTVSIAERQKSTGELASFSTKFLESAKATLRSSEAYNTIFLQVTSGLKSVREGVAGEVASLKANDTTALFDSLQGSVSNINKLNTDAIRSSLLTDIIKGIEQIIDALMGNNVIFNNMLWVFNRVYSVIESIVRQLQNLGDILRGLAADFTTFHHGFLRLATDSYHALRNLPTHIANGIKDALGINKGGKAGLGAGHWSGLSDARLKTNIQRGEEFYPGLQRASWTWNEKANALGKDGDAQGVIAQDLEQVLPQHIREFAGFKAVDYEGLKNTTGFKDGGISSGSDAGHWELLHGTEAVVPLPQGRAIPVELKTNGDNKDLQKTLRQILRTLESSADIQRNISHKSGQVLVVNSDGKKIAEETTARQGRSALEL